MTSMFTPSDRDRLLELMEPLCGPLYRSLDRAVDLSWQHFDGHGMTGDHYSAGRWQLARAHALRLIEDEQLTGDLGRWSLKRPRGNLQLCLHQGAAKLRLLRPGVDDAPPPGPNRARVAYFTNNQANLFGVDGSHFIGLWSRDPETGEVELRVVRPRGAWDFGRKAKLDLDLILPRQSEDLGRLEFRPDDEDIDLQLPFDDTEEGGNENAGGNA
ncbi:hypothetical protein Franean1_6283 [Parafrankia sp. EAN1pec]|uniref:hypothetical protein n=1 Tax=Parafrankia sp. (strain EAN1pec) TaxID=298653 RepID=UPI00005431F6|nr:hypothetical protein Franean1_6283 [Frankia sp. EAN1pec]